MFENIITKMYFCVVVFAFLFVIARGHYGVGSYGDEIIYDTSAQSKCTEVIAERTTDCRWPAGLSGQTDLVVLGGKIAAYQIQWFNGKWSGWFVPGQNDIDKKFNLNVKSCTMPYKQYSMRRWWSYFYDHTHKYIICKP